mmetsp:Transcript_6867/g.28089  ORF Transcript_6867/g.28089 Transcript_6867/m.28089 type:complete len:200 (+) Transcript_6867:1023-1622(+)
MMATVMVVWKSGFWARSKKKRRTGWRKRWGATTVRSGLTARRFLALRTHSRCPSVRMPLESISFLSRRKLSKMTPVKRLRKKKDPTTMNAMKKRTAAGLLFTLGLTSTATVSMQRNITEGQFSPEDMMKSCSMAFMTLSKLGSNGCHSRGTTSPSPDVKLNSGEHGSTAHPPVELRTPKREVAGGKSGSLHECIFPAKS